MGAKSEFIITFTAKDKNLFQGFAKLGQEAQKASGKVKETGSAAQETGKKLDEAGRKGKKSGQNIADGAKKAKTSITSLRRSAQLLTGQFALLAGGFSAAFLVRGALRGASEFGKKLAEVGTIAGVSRQELVSLGAQSRRIASGLGLPEVDAAAGLYQILSSGIVDTGDAMVVLGASSQLAVAGVSSIRESADLLTSVLNAYNFSVEDSEKLTNQFFTTVKLGKTTIPEFAASIGKVAPIAANAGVKIEELQAAIAAITLGGLSTPEAATQVRAVLVAFSKQKDVIDAIFVGAGKSADDASIRIRGLQAVLEDLFQIVSNSGGGAEALFSILGRQEAGQGVVNLTGPNQARFLRVQRGVNEGDEAAAVKEAIRVQFEEPAVRLAAIFNALATAANTASGGLLEGLANIRASTADEFQTELIEMAKVTDETTESLKDFGLFLRQAVRVAGLFTESPADRARQDFTDQLNGQRAFANAEAKKDPSAAVPGTDANKRVIAELAKRDLIAGRLSLSQQRAVVLQLEAIEQYQDVLLFGEGLSKEAERQARDAIAQARGQIERIRSEEERRRVDFVRATPEGNQAFQDERFDAFIAERNAEIAAKEATEAEALLDTQNEITRAAQQANALAKERLSILGQVSNNANIQKKVIVELADIEIKRLEAERDRSVLGNTRVNDKGKIELENKQARETFELLKKTVIEERNLELARVDREARNKKAASARKERNQDAVTLRGELQTLVALQKELGGGSKEIAAAFAEMRAAITSGEFGIAEAAKARLETLIPEAASFGSRFAKGFNKGLETLGDAAEELGGGLSTALEGYIAQIGRASGAWDQFKQQALAAIAQVIAKLLASKIIFALFGSPITQASSQAFGADAAVLGGSGGAGLGGNPFSFAQGGIQSFASGGVSDSGFVGGGIATSPVATIFGDQSSKFKGEAFVPIPGDAKGIPVDFRGLAPSQQTQSNEPVQVNFNVTAMDSKSFTDRMAQASSRDMIVGMISDAMERNTGFRQSVKGVAASA